jgi:hypothetical protein
MEATRLIVRPGWNWNRNPKRKDLESVAALVIRPKFAVGIAVEGNW